MLERWIHHYNWHRPHQGIKGLAPIIRVARSENNLLTLHSQVIPRRTCFPPRLVRRY